MLYALALSYLLYLHFIAYAAIYAAKESGSLRELPLPAKLAAILILACAVLLDTLFNATVGTVIFLELPRTWMFTTRCESHMREETWRGKLALWCCKWLNPIQSGHCH